jgi:hypothetical protein
VTVTASLSPVVSYHGLARRHLVALGFLMRPLLNSGTLGGPVERMHKSLTVEANRTLILIYAAGVALLMLVTGNIVFLSCLIGASFGVAAGSLQRRVLQTHAGAFAQATTAVDVRRVMTSSRAGTAAISMTWISAFVLLVRALFFGELALASVSWFAGFLAFMLVRDVIAYTALRFVVQVPASDPGAPP